MDTTIALKLLQLVALTIPPIAVLIQMLRRSENLAWRMRKLSFGLALTSVVAFIGAGISVLVYFLRYVNVPMLLGAGLALAVLGLIPFALFTVVLYREHKANFGP
jgi:hypothetical protein